tara:strand:+ start:275 stop:460 length:186 start_codon:yes stop_codon:yes gene_type:complete
MDYDHFDITLGKFLKMKDVDKEDMYEKILEDYKLYEAERKIVSAIIQKKLSDVSRESEDLH